MKSPKWRKLANGNQRAKLNDFQVDLECGLFDGRVRFIISHGGAYITAGASLSVTSARKASLDAIKSFHVVTLENPNGASDCRE